LTHEQAGLVKKAQESLRAARLLARDELYDFAASLNRGQAADQITRAAKFIQLARHSMTSPAAKKKNKAAK
jgi:hypothetical protein